MTQTENNSKNTGNVNKEELTFKDLVKYISELFNIIIRKWKIILFVIFIGVLCGYYYAKQIPITYTAEITYVIEDNKTSDQMSGFGGLASQFGFGGSNSGGGGMFSNIQDLVTSRFLVENALLKPIKNSKGEYTNLATYYIKLKKDKNLYKDQGVFNDINFPLESKRELLTKKQIIALKSIYLDLVLTNKLSISKKDSKSAFSIIVVISEDEEFAKYFCETLLETTSSFYIETRLKKNKINIDKLQNQVDSLKLKFNKSLYEVADANEKIFNLNQALKTKGIETSRAQVGVQANSSLLTTLISNLEMAKANLYNETPLFQIIDKPILPLTKNSPNKIKFIFLSGFFSLIVSIFFIIINYYIRKSLI